MNDPIICRCEEIRRSEIQAAIDAGCTSVTAIKKFTRAGMGPCQGRTCAKQITQILLQNGISTDGALYGDKNRFPVVPCGMLEIEEGGHE